MKLSKFISKLVFIIAFISTFLAFFVTIIFQYNSFIKEKEHIEKEYIQLKKNEIKNEVLRVFDFIEYKQEFLAKNVDIDEEVTKNQILDWISKIRFSKSGYIFVNTIDKKALVFDGEKKDNPTIHPNTSLFEKQLNAIKNKDGDFISYSFKKLNTQEEFPKVAFVKLYKKYDWIIGTGVYLDEIKKEIDRKNDIFKNIIIEQIKFFIIILIFMAIGIYFISQEVSKYINENIKNLISSFESSAKDNKKINTKKLTYKEFITLANKLNEILENKNKTEEKLQDYIKIVNEHVIISSTDENGVIRNVNNAFCEISGYKKEELIGKTHSIVRHNDMPKETYMQMWQELSKGVTWRGELKNKNKKGEAYWVEAIIQPIFEKDKLIGYTAIRNDITNKKKVEYLSITDELTQVYNRRYFNKVIQEELNRKKRENKNISFMMIDIDYFKKYNDTYGHHAGDKALEKISSIFRLHSKRSSDFVFRLGGEEFGIIFTEEDENKSFEYAENLRNEILNLNILHKSSEISPYITVSIGLVHKYANDVLDSTELYKTADKALYKAKKNGRNCIYMKQ